MISGRALIECPFCHKVGVVAFHKPSFLQAHTSRISAGAKTTYTRIPETYFVQSDCPNCKAKKKDIQAVFDGTYKRKMSHKERLELWKKRGLPLVLESK